MKNTDLKVKSYCIGICVTLELFKREIFDLKYVIVLAVLTPVNENIVSSPETENNFQIREYISILRSVKPLQGAF